MRVTGKVKRPVATVRAVVTKANGEVIDLGQVAGPDKTPEDIEKSKAGRKRLDELAKESRHG